jgi:hypothetical protein
MELEILSVFDIDNNQDISAGDIFCPADASGAPNPVAVEVVDEAGMRAYEDQRGQPPPMGDASPGAG